MKIQNADAKTKLIQRLRRIEGQVGGVQGMLADERDCREIMQQLAAVQAAVQAVSRSFLQEYAASCLLAMEEEQPAADPAQQRQQRQQLVQDMIALLDKAP
jgi:DNA-binding FrmR family transcriptional regulator